mgnify:CR=1 FL=1
MKMNKEKWKNIFEDDVPYDLDAPVIEIPREDYGIWYVDMMENPARYRGKVIEITAKVLKPSDFRQSVSSGADGDDMLCG